MNSDIDAIINKAKELSRHLKSHPSARRYDKIISQMRDDPDAQRLLASLITLGKKLNELAQSGEKIRAEDSEENERIRRELEGNTLVKLFISAQKDYLALLKAVLDSVNNPDDGLK